VQERVKEYIQKLKQLTQPKGKHSLINNDRRAISFTNTCVQKRRVWCSTRTLPTASFSTPSTVLLLVCDPPQGGLQLLHAYSFWRGAENAAATGEEQEKKENKRKAPKKKEKSRKSSKAKSPKKKLKN
jgi:hypothetical protein